MKKIFFSREIFVITRTKKREKIVIVTYIACNTGTGKELTWKGRGEKYIFCISFLLTFCFNRLWFNSRSEPEMWRFLGVSQTPIAIAFFFFKIAFTQADKNQPMKFEMRFVFFSFLVKSRFSLLNHEC